jgi:putative transposase
MPVTEAASWPAQIARPSWNPVCGILTGKRYELGEFIVMPNHVHAIVATIGDHQLSPILHSWKSFSAHKFNRILSSSGRIWLPESFDHIVRSAEHLAKFETYIRNNANHSTSLLSK